MSAAEMLRSFVSERLSAAAQEIFGAVQNTLVEYEKEIERQRMLLDIVWKPEVKLHRIDLRGCKGSEVLTEQQFTNQEHFPRVDQEDSEPPQIKEEQEEHFGSLEEEEEEEEEEEPPPNEPKRGDADYSDAQSEVRENLPNSALTTPSEPEPEPYTCSFCWKPYTCKSKLDAHMRVHTGEKPFACSTCGKTFRQKLGLKVHTRTHTGEKPYSCNICGKRFADGLNLDAHMRSHIEVSELEPNFLRSAIDEVLPDPAEVSKDILEETLQSLGVETTDDFRFLEESDLLSVLSPIQARKVVTAWKLKWQTPETCSASSCPSPAAAPPSLESMSPSSLTGADWADTYQVPWYKFPEALIQDLERGRRPSPRLRREMVRIVVSDMMERSSSVNKRNSTDIAKKMVAKYPKSLQDVIGGDVVGPGYHSLVKQMQNRIDNVKRFTTPKIRKRKESDAGDVPPEKRAAVQDTYGCVRWDVKFPPPGETPQSQQEKQEKLRRLSGQAHANPEEVKRLMKSTFYTQRKQVNQGKNIKHLLEGWPSWFTELGMGVHFMELTGTPLKETFMNNVALKGRRLLNYMRTVCAAKNRRLAQAASKVEALRDGEPSNRCGDVKEMLLLLLVYFEEREEMMLSYVEEEEDSCHKDKLQLQQLPSSPTIIVCGRSCFTATRFMLSIDRTIVEENIPSFVTSVCMMFGSYYNFNIHYPAELASTLEFLQRCFFSINPEKGTKVEKSSASRLHLKPRVLTLIKELSDHEALQEALQRQTFV